MIEVRKLAKGIAKQQVRSLTVRCSVRQPWPWLRHPHLQCRYPPLAAHLTAPLSLFVRQLRLLTP